MSTKKMPGPDEALKNFFENNEVFADVFNSYLFKDDVIDPSELQPANTAYTDTVKTTKGVEKIGKYRDNIRKTTVGAKYVILGIEDQNKVHYAMPIRTMLYNVLGYCAECKSLGVTQEAEGWTIDEFLSKISKGTKLTPIYTVVFYTGERAWDGPRSLHDMLEIDREHGKYIPNIPLNLIDVGHDDLNFTNTALKELNFLLKGIYNKSLENDTSEISNSIWNLTAILTGEPSLYGKKEGGRTIVCNALNEMKQKSMIEGRAEGGNLMIYSLVQDLLLTPEVGSKRLGITVEELKNRMILYGYNFPER